MQQKGPQSPAGIRDQTVRDEAHHVLRLDRSTARRFAEAIVVLDQAVLREYGRDYTDEPWAREHFLKALPGKWRYSVCTVDGQRRLRAFWIASLNSDPSIGVYTHRVAVESTARSVGLGWQMYRELRRRATEDNCSRLSLSVSVSNQAALKFYQKAGFATLSGSELDHFVAAKGLSVAVEHDCIREPTGHRKFIMTHPLDRGRDL